MRDILAVARAQLACSLRERITLFWFLVFPLFLLTLLSLIFSNVGQTEDLSFQITVVNLDRGSQSGSYATAVVETFRALSRRDTSGESPLFTLHEPTAGCDAGAFLEDELGALRVGKRSAVVVIPEEFSQGVVAAAAAGRDLDATAAVGIAVHTSGGRTGSDIALGVIDQVLAGVNKQLLVSLGLFDPAREVEVARVKVGSENKDFRYVDFLVPGVIVMGFFTAGLFSVPGTILFGRESKILRAYWVTPLNAPRFLAGFALGHLALCVLQLACVWALGRFALGAQIDLFQPLALVYLALSIVTFLCLGFLVAAVAKTPNSGMAMANIVNMPMMFLGGLFFPTGSVPPGLRAILLVNPVTYLAEGLRASVGVGAPTYGHPVMLAVPCVWIVGCVVVASLRLKWDVGR